MRTFMLTACVLVSSCLSSLASANAVTDWDEKAVALASSPAPAGQRELALVHIAMFDTLNSIERRYRPYLLQMPVKSGTSQEAAAASAAARVLQELHPEREDEIAATLATYLNGTPAGGKADGVALGASIANRILESRRGDGAAVADVYRLPAKPGLYVPTMTMVGSAWPAMQPFGLSRPSLFRPAPPVALESEEWAANYQEVRDFGHRHSSKRSAQQTEVARFWLMTGAPAYQPLGRQLAIRNRMSLLDTSRFMTLYSIALTDAYIAVFDAKYFYQFWRPVTSIRHADIDGNSATQSDPSWLPLADTPMHPEYPCAHCIQGGAAASVIRAILGTEDLSGVTLTSPTAPGVTRGWKRLEDFTAEVENARVWAGFHYRFSSQVGTGMGLKIGDLVARNLLQPVPAR